MDVASKGHKRSKSDSAMKRGWEDKFSYILEASHRLKLDMGELKSCVKVKKRQSLSTEVQNSLKQEILQLQKQLEDQFVVRSALEKALTCRPLSHEATNEKPITKPAEDLIKEISILEMEVVNMEKYLLSLYRKTFEERVPFLSELDGKSKPTSATHKRMSSEDSGHDVTPKYESSVMNSNFFNPVKESGRISGEKTLLDSSIHRSNSSLSHRSASFRTRMGSIKEAVFSYHSLPLSMLEHNGDEDHLGTSIPDHILKQPNWLSEEMIKCITAIYSELAEPPLINQCFPSSPFSFSSSISNSSPSPKGRKISSQPSWMDNPFNIEGSKELDGSYNTMVEVNWICRDSQRLTQVKDMLQSYRSLVFRLEEIDPEKMKHEEKLAFWINVHNALVMHAFLVYGIPQNNLKRISLLLKAAYNVGGHTVSVNMIQNSILGCRLPRPGQWLQSLFFPKTKFKVGDARKVFAIDHSEPRLYFALCSGSRSDPVVRMYTPKSVFQDLEAAKEDYIHTTFKIQKEQKILLPKIVHTFVKESGLCPAGFVELIEDLMPDFLSKAVEQHQHGKFWKRIEWIPHNFTFRYLLSKELAK
ncbi:uncharacterized protein LOC130779286 [Actinidia eriantha]|uniref:uncharacterized protein LOC130779286 n=1 Tax=Actinidia eriantha TaxID=165200 RepID=UPI00258C1416|nr:uncharacterized protein LOC130779286 [Actinidia eriantha]